MTASEQRGEHVTVRGSDNGGDTDGIQATFATYFLDYVSEEISHSAVITGSASKLCIHTSLPFTPSMLSPHEN